MASATASTVKFRRPRLVRQSASLMSDAYGDVTTTKPEVDTTTMTSRSATTAVADVLPEVARFRQAVRMMNDDQKKRYRERLQKLVSKTFICLFCFTLFDIVIRITGIVGT